MKRFVIDFEQCVNEHLKNSSYSLYHIYIDSEIDFGYFIKFYSQQICFV